MTQPRDSDIDVQFRCELIAAIPHLRRYAWSLIRNHPSIDADDLVQMAAERGLAKADSYRPTSTVKVWLLAILHNIYVDKMRQLGRETRTLHAVGNAVRATASSVAAGSSTDDVAIRDVARAMDSLPVEQKQVVLLVGLEGLRYMEAAEVLGIPVGTVRSRLSRAREALRLALGAHGHREVN